VKGEIMKEKLTPETIKKAVKILMKHKIKPDEDGLITIENPIYSYDLLNYKGRNK
jgi:hypothetical protein